MRRNTRSCKWKRDVNMAIPKGGNHTKKSKINKTAITKKNVVIDSAKMHHVFRLISHIIYRYFTMFCHCYVLFCQCFRYLLITEHMRVRRKKGARW